MAGADCAVFRRTRMDTTAMVVVGGCSHACGRHTTAESNGNNGKCALSERQKCRIVE